MREHVALIRQQKPHKWLFYRLPTFPTLRRAIAVHCVGGTEAEGARKVLGNNTRILLIPNRIDSQEVKVAERPAREGMTICFLGHIQQEKGINGFIRVWLQCRRDADRLVIAGRGVDGVYLEEFQGLVRQAGGAISYRGYLSREEVMEVLGNSDFLVLPSGLEAVGGMRENFGNVVAEAMAAGRPVLVARGLAWDHVESLGAGFVFDRPEVSVCDIVRQARSLDAANWQRMSRNARQYFEQHLDAERLGEQIWQVLIASEPGVLSRQIVENPYKEIRLATIL